MLSRYFVPDTLNYMIAGYLVISVMIFGYILSLFLRWRRTIREISVLQKESKELLP